MEKTNQMEKMTFKSLHEKKKKEVANFIKEYCTLLDNMPVSTFYYKLANNSFNALEKQIIANYRNEPIETLFPEPEKTTA